MRITRSQSSVQERFRSTLISFDSFDSFDYLLSLVSTLEQCFSLAFGSPNQTVLMAQHSAKPRRTNKTVCKLYRSRAGLNRIFLLLDSNNSRYIHPHVYICVCVCVCVYVYVCVRVYTYICMYVNIRMYVCMYVACVAVCMHLRMPVCARACVHV